MRPAIKAAILTILFGFTCLSFAYEPGTHGEITTKAVANSNLSDIIADLGFKKGIADESQQFPDPQSDQFIDLMSQDDATKYVANSKGSVLDLIYAGSVLEDEGDRALFHFYDPTPGHFDPLNIGGVVVPYSNPDWATKESMLPVVGQKYSIKDANDYFYNALTSPAEDDRNLAFGNLFLSLGHIMHLLEDAAQPQHVRNDMHCDADICKDGEKILKDEFGKSVKLYNPSLYEALTYNAPVSSFGGNYPPVTFVLDPTFTTRGFWGNTNFAGLAQFTNSNFVSAGTNFLWILLAMYSQIRTICYQSLSNYIIPKLFRMCMRNLVNPCQVKLRSIARPRRHLVVCNSYRRR